MMAALPTAASQARAGAEEDRQVLNRIAMLNQTEDSTEFQAKKYKKKLNIAVIFSMWALSCIVAYAYWYKYNANVDYNKLIRDHNTKKLEYVMKDLRRASAEYKKYAKGESTGDGLKIAKDNLFFQIRKTSELFDKCNYIKMLNTDSDFPWAEVAVSCLLLFILCGVVLWSNISNNPISNMKVSDRIAKLRQEIMQMDEYAKETPIEDDFKDPAFRSNYRESAKDRIRTMEEKDNLSEPEIVELNKLKIEEHKHEMEDDKADSFNDPAQKMVNLGMETASNIQTLFGKKKRADVTLPKGPVAKGQAAKGNKRRARRRQRRQKRMRGGNASEGDPSSEEEEDEDETDDKGYSSDYGLTSGGAGMMVPSYAMQMPPPKIETDLFDNKHRRLDLIHKKRDRLNIELNLLKSDATFNQSTITIIIVIATMYLGLTIVMSATGYTKNLYSGRLFTQSRCVS